MIPQREPDIRAERSFVLGEPPQLSIVVASVYSHQELETWLDTLVQQVKGKQIETIVADCSQDGSLSKMMAKYRGVIFIPFPTHTALPVLLGAGIAKSTGNIIAITDSTSFPDEQWIASILKAHEASHPVIGGAVEVNGCKRLVDWAAYFCDYSKFMCPLAEGVVRELPGNNLSFKRWALGIGQQYVQNGFWKTYWCRTLQEAGIELLLVPSIKVNYKKSFRLFPFLIRRFHHGRCFAGMRIKQASILTRSYYWAASHLLPVLLLFRTVTTVLPKKRHQKEFVISFPILLLSIISWSLGEYWGYLAGSGKSCAHIY